MRVTVSRTIFGTSTYVLVEISPETTTRPVFTSVSHATRPVGSSRITASRTPSEIWSAILSGWPSVTDSEVNRNSSSERGWVIDMGGEGSGSGWPSSRCRSARALVAPPEVDHQRNALEPVALAQAVLQEVGVVAHHPGAVGDRYREARRPRAVLGHVVQREPPAAHRGRLAGSL